jgi:hypothetical protein
MNKKQGRDIVSVIPKVLMFRASRPRFAYTFGTVFGRERKLLSMFA